MTFTKTQKTYLRPLEKKVKKDFKTTSFRKVLFFPVSLIIPHPHSTLCGYPFRANFRKTFLISPSGTGTAELFHAGRLDFIR
jgi:hypothetical protein